MLHYRTPGFSEGFLAGGFCTWVKPGRFGSFFVPCFLALGGRCLQMLCLLGFGTRANTQNLPHFRACPASIQEQCPPKCLFFMANAKLPNRPGFALLPLGFSDSEKGSAECSLQCCFFVAVKSSYVCKVVTFFFPYNPVGQKRHIDVAGQKLPRDNFCLSLVSQLPSPRG